MKRRSQPVFLFSSTDLKLLSLLKNLLFNLYIPCRNKFKFFIIFGCYRTRLYTYKLEAVLEKSNNELNKKKQL